MADVRVFTNDGNVHAFRNVEARVYDTVLTVTKNPRAPYPDYVNFPLVNVMRWETAS